MSKDLLTQSLTLFIQKNRHTRLHFSVTFILRQTNKVYNTFAQFFNFPLRFLNMLSDDVKASPHLDLSTLEYRLNAMIMDVTHHRLFKPPQILRYLMSKISRLALKIPVTKDLNNAMIRWRSTSGRIAFFLLVK